MALPGLTPRFPVINVGPVLVTVEPPKTAKLCAAPRSETVWATSEDIDEASTTKKTSVNGYTAYNLCPLDLSAELGAAFLWG